MLSVNKGRKYIQLAFGIIPVALSVISVFKQSLILFLLTIVSLFAVVGLVPVFRKRESFWMFLLVAVAGVPENINLIFWIIYLDVLYLYFLPIKIIYSLLIYFVLFSVEEIAFGVITRFIWPRQYKLKI